MYKTKTAWKVVSDPYAPESRWVPAFAEVCGAEGPDYEMHASGAQKPKTTSRKVSEAVALSVVAGLLGGAFAGQCVHLTYFAHHLFEQVVFNHFYFEPWGAFYFWYNQNNSAFVYIPLFFSYSMGFWASIHNLGKGFNALNFGILALYILTMSGLHQYVPFISEQQYFSTLLGAGMAGSIIAFFLGKTIAKNISAVINPRLIFLSLFFVFIPAMCPILPSMGRFDVIATAYVVAVFGIGCAIRCMHNGSLKTSILLSLTAASPLVLCGLMHIPAANHFRTATALLHCFFTTHFFLGWHWHCR